MRSSQIIWLDMKIGEIALSSSIALVFIRLLIKGEIYLLLLGILICWLSEKINVWYFDLLWNLCFRVRAKEREAWCTGLILEFPENLEIKYLNWICGADRMFQIMFSKTYKNKKQNSYFKKGIERIYCMVNFLYVE